MKKTYYCVMSEFYTDGRVLAGIKSRQCKEKPNDKSRKPYGMAAYEDWYESREEAEAALLEIKTAIA